MWIVVTLIGGIVGVIIGILITPMDDHVTRKFCIIGGFFIGAVVFTLCLYSSTNMKDFSKVYQICEIKDNQYITEKNNGYVSVLCKDGNEKTTLEFPNSVVAYKETDKNPWIKVEGTNYMITPPFAKQEEECDKYTKVIIYFLSDEEKTTEIKCEDCGTSNTADSVYCKKCGKLLNQL